MNSLRKKFIVTLVGVVLVLLLGGAALIWSEEEASRGAASQPQTPIVIAQEGSQGRLERPAPVFDHARHTKALKQLKVDDCAACHSLEQKDPNLSVQEVRVFKFPKKAPDGTDKASIMVAYHTACAGCHEKMRGEAKEAGPPIGLCGSCHVRGREIRKVRWARDLVFDYALHARHVQAVEDPNLGHMPSLTPGLEIIGAAEGKKCETCHHSYDPARKKLFYRKDTENSCQACHKEKDELNARSMKKVAHAACIGCHMKLAERARAKGAAGEKSPADGKEKKGFGPYECAGCHRDRKELTPEEIMKLPRLVRGQKDMMDLYPVPKADSVPGQTAVGPDKSLVALRMKATPFNHKSHEPRAQFCGSCHHHSLENCVNCHTLRGDPKKGGGVTLERAFHDESSRRSCAGCHSTVTDSAKCAGCHQWGPVTLPTSSCGVCHRGPSDGKPLEVAAIPPVTDKEKVPEKIQIKTLENEYKPAEFPHMKVVNSLIKLSNDNTLARWFHQGKEEILCSGCHHRSELQQAAVKAPKCGTCHTRPFQKASLGKPGLMGAYHRQCIGCHEAMKQRPLALECAKCHQRKDGSRTARVIPPVPGNN